MVLVLIDNYSLNSIQQGRSFVYLEDCKLSKKRNFTNATALYYHQQKKQKYIHKDQQQQLSIKKKNINRRISKNSIIFPSKGETLTKREIKI